LRSALAWATATPASDGNTDSLMKKLSDDI
jgi:hypothetical protein